MITPEVQQKLDALKLFNSTEEIQDAPNGEIAVTWAEYCTQEGEGYSYKSTLYGFEPGGETLEEAILNTVALWENTCVQFDWDIVGHRILTSKRVAELLVRWNDGTKDQSVKVMVTAFYVDEYQHLKEVDFGKMMAKTAKEALVMWGSKRGGYRPNQQSFNIKQGEK